MKIQTFEVKVAVPEYCEEISVDDLFEVLQQTGDERMDLHECAWKVIETENYTYESKEKKS